MILFASPTSDPTARRILGWIFFLNLLYLPGAKAEVRRDRSITGGRSLTHLLNFELEYFSVNQDRGGQATSFRFSLSPHLQIVKRIALKGELGVTYLKDESNKSFPILHAGLFTAGYFFDSMGIELGFGLEDWTNHGGPSMWYEANLVLKLGYIAGFIDRAFIGYRVLLLSHNFTQGPHLGAGFVF